MRKAKEPRWEKWAHVPFPDARVSASPFWLDAWNARYSAPGDSLRSAPP
jgi:hypothetical protein